MLREILENTEGAVLYAVIGLVIFVLSFSGIVIWILKKDKGYLKRMKNLPLEEESQSAKNTNGENNEIK